MSNLYGTFIPSKFDLTELNNRIEASKANIDPHITIVEDSVRFLDAYDSHTKEGYKRDPKYPPLIMGAVVQLQLLKPKKVLDKELEQLAIEIEATYKAEIKADQAEAVRRMQARIIGEAQSKLEKQRAIEQAEIEASALAEAMEILQVEELGELTQ